MRVELDDIIARIERMAKFSKDEMKAMSAAEIFTNLVGVSKSAMVHDIFDELRTLNQSNLAPTTSDVMGDPNQGY